MIDLPGTVSKLNELKFTRDDLSVDPIRSFKDADSQQFLCALQVHPDIHSFIFMGPKTVRKEKQNRLNGRIPVFGNS